jgi:DNA-binding PadR family transcriptional regulator
MRGKQFSGFATFPLENAALGLVMAGPKHGYELYRDFTAAFGPVWKAGRSKFYAVLSALHESGYLEFTIEFQEDRPPRKIYRLTDAGRETFLGWLYRPVAPIHRCRVELLSKLRFFTLLDLPDPGRLLDAQLDACRTALDGLARSAAGQREAGEDAFYELVYSFREKQFKALIEWLLECKERFKG